MNKHLAIDIGASSYRMIINSEDTFLECSRYNDHVKVIDGTKYWDIKAIYNNIINCLYELKDKNLRVTSISINSFGCDFAPIIDNYKFDDEGYLLTNVYASNYANGPTNEERTFIDNTFTNEQLFELTAINLQDFNSIYRLANLKNKVTFIASYLNMLLTGECYVDQTIASTSQLLDKDCDMYNTEILDKLNIEQHLLPQIKQAGTFVAPIKVEKFSNINVIFGAGHDTALAFSCYDDKTIILNVGSWIITGVNVNEPKYLDNRFNYERGLITKYKMVTNNLGMNGFNMLLSELMIGLSFDELAAELSRLNCERTIDINQIQISQKISDQLDSKLSKLEMIAVYLNSIAHETCNIINELNHICDDELQTIAIIGGGSENEYFMNKLTSLIGHNYQIISGEREATVVGNLKLQKQVIEERIR